VERCAGDGLDESMRALMVTHNRKLRPKGTRQYSLTGAFRFMHIRLAIAVACKCTSR
jgi:hypothetical protein